MAHARKKLGDWGESVAVTHLEAHGYQIEARNWRHSTVGELDIVALKGERRAFVEVKTRRGRASGSPEEAITPRKVAKLMALVLVYLAEHEIDEESDFGIDLVAVELDKTGKLIRCEHIENVVSAW